MPLINQGINPDAYNSLTEEDRASLFGLSEAENELDDLKAQRSLANMLAKGGTTYQPKAPSNTIGGAAFALGQGLEGYMAGRDIKKNREDMGALRQRNIDATRKYHDALFKKDQPNPFTGQGWGDDEEAAKRLEDLEPSPQADFYTEGGEFTPGI